MRPAVVIVIVVALVIAGATAFLLNRVLNRNGAVQEASPVVTGNVLVAATDIPAGTILQSKHYKWQFWPESARQEDFVMERTGEHPEDEFDGSVVRRGLSAGEPITAAKVFKRGSAGFLSGALNPGMRAVSIPTTAATSAGGFVLPGDRVDVILTQQFRGDRNAGRNLNVASETILRDIRVLAVDQEVNDVESKATVGKTTTLEVTPKQAEILALASRMGRLSLSLRSLTPGPADAQNTAFTSDREVSEALEKMRGAAGLTAPKASPQAPATPRTRVLVASRDLKAGTFLRDTYVSWHPVNPGAFVDDSITESDDERARLKGALVVADVKQGAQVPANAVLAPSDAGFVSAALRPGERAITLSREAVAGIAEFVSPGDRVDIVLTQQIQDGGGAVRHSSETIVQNVRLIALNPKAGTAAVEVTPKDAATLSVARQMGKIGLVLRSSEGPGGAEAAASANDTDISDAFGRGLADRSARAKPAKPSAPRVLAAARALPAGHFLRDADLKFEPVDDGVVGTGTYAEGAVDRSRLRGALTRTALAAGAVLRDDQLILPSDAGYLAAALKPGKRAITIGKDAVAGIAEFVTPGDHVDVVLTQQLAGEGGGPTRHISETILQDVRLLARDPRAGTAALEVTANQAAEVAVAQRMGQISLALRSGATAAGTDTAATARDTDVSTLFAGQGDATPRTAGVPLGMTAAKPLAPGDFLREESVSWAPLPPEASAAGGYIVGSPSDNGTLRGALVRKAVKAGGFIMATDILRPDEPGFVSAALAPGKRAITLDRDSVAGISPFVTPGDHVDVVLTQDLADQSGGDIRRHTSETILQDIRLLALDRKGGTAALEVSPQEAASLSVARRMGQISLSLRSVGASGVGQTASASDSEVSAAFDAGLPKPAKPTQAAPAPAAPARAVGYASRVLVAAHDMPKGKLLRDTDVRFEAVETAEPGVRYYVEDRDKPAEVRGGLLLKAIKAGQPLHSDILILPGEPGFLAEVLSPGMRAVSIAVNAVSGISGYVSPDDRVDVVLTQAINDLQGKATPDPILDPRRFSETIMQDVRVIAIKQTIDESSGQPIASNTVTLEVAPQKAEVLSLAATMGTLSLALRGGHPGVNPDIGVTYTSDIGISNAAADLVNRARVLNRSRATRPAPSSKAAARPTRPPATTVKLYRGSHSQSMEF